jgi:hypothetical protein
MNHEEKKTMMQLAELAERYAKLHADQEGNEYPLNYADEACIIAKAKRMTKQSSE